MEKIFLKPKRERSLLHRHPWVFSGALQNTLPDTYEGEIVAVYSAGQVFMGYGFFSSRSQISCRMFFFGKDPIIIDEAFWEKKIWTAFELRDQYVVHAPTNAYRLIHAEGDFFPGLIVDIYDTVAVVQLLIKGTEKIHNIICNALQKLGFKHVYLKTKESSKNLEDMQLSQGWLSAAELPEPVIILENNYHFEVDFIKGQKTGFFLDQRDNRQLVKTFSKGKSLLNTFSYTGGFSVYGLAGGAQEVTSVDSSAEAIRACDKNIALNFGQDAPHQAIVEDCFDFLKASARTYDIIILDPPAFAKNARAVPNAARGYKELNMLGLKKVNPGGLIFTFSCSGNIDRDLFRKIVFGAAADVGKNVRILYQLAQPADHPVNIYHPEGEYLKGLVLEVE